MQNVSRNHHLSGGMHLPARVSPRLPASRRSSTSSSDSPGPPPLTPHNTFNETDFLDVLSGLDTTQLNLGDLDLDDKILSHVEVVEIIDVASDDGSETRRSQSLSRSSPSSQLRSALASSRRSSARSEPTTCTKKRARFDDDVITSDVLLRKAMTEIPLERRKSAPAEVSVRVGASSAGEDEDEEVAAAIGIFEEVIEELMQVAEEHEEAHEQLVEVAREVAEAIIESEEIEYEADIKDTTESDDRDSDDIGDLDEVEYVASPCFIRQTTADEDVDETCIEPEGISIDDFANGTLDEDIYTSPTTHCHPSEVEMLTDTEFHSPLESQSSIDEQPGESSGSSAETVIRLNFTKDDGTPRRAFDSPVDSTSMVKWHELRRSASLPDADEPRCGHTITVLPSKGSPAGCALTACSVRAASSPKLNAVYEYQEASARNAVSDIPTTITAQTVCSDIGSFQVLWEEPTLSSSSSSVTLFPCFDPGDEAATGALSATPDRAQIPMDKVKTKLAAWSWARENALVDDDGNPTRIPLLPFEMQDSQRASNLHTPGSEGPSCPPNTERESGASSGKHSVARSPPAEQEMLAEDNVDIDDGDEAIELRAKAVPYVLPKGRTPGTQCDYLDVPKQQSRSLPDSPSGSGPTKAITRQLSNLAANEAHFKTHRDSLVLLRKKEHEEEATNQHLMNSQDSLVLTRFKFETRYPSSPWLSKQGRTRRGELSTVVDASQSDSRRDLGSRSRPANRFEEEEDSIKSRGSEKSSDEHNARRVNETEQPPWFEGRIRSKVLM